MSEGPTRGLLDFSHIEAVDIPIETLKKTGAQPQNIAGQVRVYVIPNDGHFGDARVFSAYQDNSGNVAPHIVRTMAEAHRLLQITDPSFQPLNPDP